MKFDEPPHKTSAGVRFQSRDSPARLRYAAVSIFFVSLALSFLLPQIEAYVVAIWGEPVRSPTRWTVAWTYLVLMCLAWRLWVRTFGGHISVWVANVLLVGSGMIALIQWIRWMLIVSGGR